MEYLLLVVGFVILIRSADMMVRSASALARSFGVSSMMIGLTVVAIGTSMPEAAIGIMAGINHANQITLGTVIGSTIVNVTLIIGIVAILYPLKVEITTLTIDIPLTIAIQIVFLLFLLTGSGISRIEAVILLAGFLLFLLYLKKSAATAKRMIGDLNESVKESQPLWGSRWRHGLITIIGLAGIALGSQLIVDSAVKIATNFGLSETVIGATIIAIGTSLPEMVVGIISVSKKEHKLMVGNIIGSNIFNILFVLGISGTIFAIDTPQGIWFDLVSMFVAMLAFWVLASRNKIVSRLEGFILLSLYLFFLSLTTLIALN